MEKGAGFPTGSLTFRLAPLLYLYLYLALPATVYHSPFAVSLSNRA